jgi:dCTP deaminase
MTLSDTSIRALIGTGELQILPAFDGRDIRPTGIRLHLGDELLVPVAGQRIDLGGSVDPRYECATIPEDGYALSPGAFVLGATHECVRTPATVVGHLEGRSTLARLGLAIHCTSGIVDGNHDEARAVVLEMTNQGAFELVLRRRMPVAMLRFSRLTEPIGQRSQEQYRGQTGVRGPNLRFDPKR